MLLSRETGASLLKLGRDKPRKEIVLSLSRQTFLGRRSSVLSPAEDVCVWSLLSEYSELKKPYVVSCPRCVVYVSNIA